MIEILKGIIYLLEIFIKKLLLKNIKLGDLLLDLIIYLKDIISLEFISFENISEETFISYLFNQTLSQIILDNNIIIRLENLKLDILNMLSPKET
jgi:hypothetical protein